MTLVPYEEALAFMEERAAAIRAGTARECVWLLEHPPLFTAGTSADPAELFNPLRLSRVYEAGRGGRYTYHGPGQRVGYLMLDLDRRGRDVRRLVHSLEGWIIATLAELGVQRSPGRRTHRNLGRRRLRRKRKSPRSAFASSAGSPSTALRSTCRPTCRISAASFRAGSANSASPAFRRLGKKCR